MQKEFLIKRMWGQTYLPAPEVNEYDGVNRRMLMLRSTEYAPEERDEIIAVLWDSDAFLDLNVGDEVLVTLQFRPNLCLNGTHYHADVVEIKKVSELKENGEIKNN